MAHSSLRYLWYQKSLDSAGFMDLGQDTSRCKTKTAAGFACRLAPTTAKIDTTASHPAWKTLSNLFPRL